MILFSLSLSRGDGRVGFSYDSCMSTPDDLAAGDPSPLPAPAPCPRLRLADRAQLLPPMPLDDLLTDDHQARIVWRFVEGLDLTDLYARIRAVEGHPGRPPADPRILTALWLSATLEGVGSA